MARCKVHARARAGHSGFQASSLPLAYAARLPGRTPITCSRFAWQEVHLLKAWLRLNTRGQGLPCWARGCFHADRRLYGLPYGHRACPNASPSSQTRVASTRLSVAATMRSNAAHSAALRVLHLLKGRLQLAHEDEVSQAGRVAARHIRPRAQRALQAGERRHQLGLPAGHILRSRTSHRTAKANAVQGAGASTVSSPGRQMAQPA